MIRKLFSKALSLTIRRYRAHTHLRRFSRICRNPPNHPRWTRMRMTLFLFVFSQLQGLWATGFSEVHVVEAQWMDIRQLLQTQVEALKAQEITAVQSQMIAQTVKSMELMQTAQAAIAFQMKTGIPALQLHGQILQKSPNGLSRFVPANGLQFNGQTGLLEGGNFGFVDHLLSQRGVPISMDKMARSWIVPVSGAQAEQLLQKSQEFIKSAAKPLLKAATDSIIGKSENASVLKSVINPVGDQVIDGILGNGIFIRPYEPGKDDAYAYYQNASEQEKMAYLSSSLYRNGSSVFNPILGSVSDQIADQLPSSVDLANTFSAGAKAAIDNFLQSGGEIPTTGTFKNSTENPYEGFAADLYDEVIETIRSGQIKPGDPILITDEMVQKARLRTSSSSVPQSVKAFPSLFNETPKLSLDELFLSFFSPSLAAIGRSGGSGLSGAKKYILAATGSPEEIQQLQSLCAASDQRLGEIQKQIGYQSQMMQYTQELLQSLQMMRIQAQTVQQTLTPLNAIPQITEMLVSIDEAISARDRDIATYQKAVQQLQGERFEELKSRSERVTKNHQEQQTTANQQLARSAK